MCVCMFVSALEYLLHAACGDFSANAIACEKMRKKTNEKVYIIAYFCPTAARPAASTSVIFARASTTNYEHFIFIHAHFSRCNRHRLPDN